MRYGKFKQLGHDKISWKNVDARKDPIPKRKIWRPRKDRVGHPHSDHFPPRKTKTRMGQDLTMLNMKIFKLFEI